MHVIINTSFLIPQFYSISLSPYFGDFIAYYLVIVCYGHYRNVVEQVEELQIDIQIVKDAVNLT
jgi:hypothetical protein